MLKELFKSEKEKQQERREMLWRRADALTQLGRPATKKELEEFSSICDELGVKTEEMPVVLCPSKVCTA